MVFFTPPLHPPPSVMSLIKDDGHVIGYDFTHELPTDWAVSSVSRVGHDGGSVIGNTDILTTTEQLHANLNVCEETREKNPIHFSSDSALYYY